MSRKQSSKTNDVRKSEREEIELKAIVQGYSAPDAKWKETITVENVSKSGASFHLSHGCPIGTLLTLLIPLPAKYRAYDFAEKIYPVIGLVQYCTETIMNGESSFKVGVAFVGKSFPESFSANPMQNYHIVGVHTSGVWKIAESTAPFAPRGGVRYWAPTNVTVSLFQRGDRNQSKEDARAINISSSGALVVSSLKPEQSERVKLGFKEHDFYTLAVVRNCRPAKEGKWAVHLEFIDSHFPLKKIIDSLANANKIEPKPDHEPAEDQEA